MRDLTTILYDTALLVSGFSLGDPSEYANKIYRLLALGLSLDPDSDQPAPAAADADTEMPALEETAASNLEDVVSPFFLPFLSSVLTSRSNRTEWVENGGEAARRRFFFAHNR